MPHQKIDWIKTLRNVIYKSSANSIEFTIEDVDDLAKYINNKDDVIAKLKAKLTFETKVNSQLRADALTKALDIIVIEEVSQFIKYA